MSDPKTDPYEGELPVDADLGPGSDEDSDAESLAEPDDELAEDYADTSGMRAEGEAPLP